MAIDHGRCGEANTEKVDENDGLKGKCVLYVCFMLGVGWGINLGGLVVSM